MDSQLILSQKKQKSSFGSKIELLSPAKINLYLNIVGKYPGGYHRIESIAERVSLCDRLSIQVNRKPAINITSSNRRLETEENLSYRAARLMKRKFRLPFGFDIYLEKNIPVGSGLGGGSSNAAFTILGIKQLFSLQVCRSELEKIGRSLGSDVNFFLSDSRYAYLSGRGERVEPLPSKVKLNHIIIWPGIFVSTKKVYKSRKSYLPAGRQELTRFFSNVNMLKYSLKNLDYSFLKKGVYNCLEKRAFTLYENLAMAKIILNRNDIDSVMSGSGGAFFTIGSNNYKEIKKVVPDNWLVRKVRTF